MTKRNVRSEAPLYVVEIFEPRSWRPAMSIEFCANACPSRKDAKAAADKYQRYGFKARVVLYRAVKVLPSAPSRAKKARRR